MVDVSLCTSCFSFDLISLSCLCLVYFFLIWHTACFVALLIIQLIFASSCFLWHLTLLTWFIWRARRRMGWWRPRVNRIGHMLAICQRDMFPYHINGTAGAIIRVIVLTLANNGWFDRHKTWQLMSLTILVILRSQMFAILRMNLATITSDGYCVASHGKSWELCCQVTISMLTNVKLTTHKLL